MPPLPRHCRRRAAAAPHTVYCLLRVQDHYGLTEHEVEVGNKKKFRTPDEEVGFAERKFGPPGLAEPLLISNSLGNHRYVCWGVFGRWGSILWDLALAADSGTTACLAHSL